MVMIFSSKLSMLQHEMSLKNEQNFAVSFLNATTLNPLEPTQPHSGRKTQSGVNNSKFEVNLLSTVHVQISFVLTWSRCNSQIWIPSSLGGPNWWKYITVAIYGNNLWTKERRNWREYGDESTKDKGLGGMNFAHEESFSPWVVFSVDIVNVDGWFSRKRSDVSLE